MIEVETVTHNATLRLDDYLYYTSLVAAAANDQTQTAFIRQAIADACEKAAAGNNQLRRAFRNLGDLDHG